VAANDRGTTCLNAPNDLMQSSLFQVLRGLMRQQHILAVAYEVAPAITKI